MSPDTLALDARVRLSRPQFELDIELILKRPAILSLFGPSGSGKTTTLRVLAGLERQSRGHVRLAGAPPWEDRDQGVFLPPHRRHVGMVFQDTRLYPHLDTLGNLRSGALLRHGTVDEGLLGEVCALLDLESLLSRSVDQLSGGEQQRVAIGRCLLTRPELLLLDEPLSAVDADRKQEILPYLVRLHVDLEVPLIHVSHDWNEVLRIADEVLVLDAGRVVDRGSPAQVNSRRTATRDRLNLLEGVVRQYDRRDELLAIQVADHVLQVAGAALGRGTRVRALVSENEVAISRQPLEDTSVLNVLPVSFLGSEVVGPGSVRLNLDLARQPLSAVISSRSFRQLALQDGENLFVLIKSASIELIEEPTG